MLPQSHHPPRSAPSRLRYSRRPTSAVGIIVIQIEDFLLNLRWLLTFHKRHLFGWSF